MRKLILSAAVAVLALASTSVKANTTSNNEITNVAAQDTLAKQESLNKTAVKLEEIPDAVKAALKSDTVKDWTPTAAFLVKTKEGAEYYQIDVTKGQDKGSLRLDKNGKSVK
jgi:hypothetical protein